MTSGFRDLLSLVLRWLESAPSSTDWIVCTETVGVRATATDDTNTRATATEEIGVRATATHNSEVS